MRRASEFDGCDVRLAFDQVYKDTVLHHQKCATAVKDRDNSDSKEKAPKTTAKVRTKGVFSADEDMKRVI